MKETSELRREATAWFLDIHDAEDPSPELLQEWMQWMEASVEHRRAFMAVERTWQTSAACVPPAPSRKPPDDYDGSVSVSKWRESQPAMKPNIVAYKAWWRRPSVQLIGALAATVASISVYVGASRNLPGDGNSFVTRAGEQMQVALPDGSEVSLGAKSKLTVAYTTESRDVRLLTGEAFFTVQKDTSRPFRVHVLAGVLTAVGTAFDVRTTYDRVRVAVTDGTVQVDGASTETAATPPAARLRPGEAMSFVGTPGHSLESARVLHVDPTEQTRWREGWLVYRDEPLQEVLADVSRYVNSDIIVSPALATDVHFTGVVNKDSIVEWLKSLPNAFPVNVRVDGTRVLVSAIAPIRAKKTF